jgi:hypothetical protein
MNFFLGSGALAAVPYLKGSLIPQGPNLGEGTYTRLYKNINGVIVFDTTSN